jgi:hypothetical protein
MAGFIEPLRAGATFLLPNSSEARPAISLQDAPRLSNGLNSAPIVVEWIVASTSQLDCGSSLPDFGNPHIGFGDTEAKPRRLCRFARDGCWPDEPVGYGRLDGDFVTWWFTESKVPDLSEPVDNRRHE